MWKKVTSKHFTTKHVTFCLDQETLGWRMRKKKQAAVITRQAFDFWTLLSSKAMETISEVIQSTYRGKHSEHFSTVNLLRAIINTQTSCHSVQALSFHQAGLKRPVIKSKTAPSIISSRWCISIFTWANPNLLSVINMDVVTLGMCGSFHDVRVCRVPPASLPAATRTRRGTVKCLHLPSDYGLNIT